MAKGKTQFTCTEKRIDRSKWRWTVSYLGECLGTGIAKTQAECRTEKDRVKKEFLDRQGSRPTQIHDVEKSLVGKHLLEGHFTVKGSSYLGGAEYMKNRPDQFVPSITPDLRPV